DYSVLSWPSNLPLPSFEMNISLVLTGAAILLIPFFIVTAIFKVGNLANDGHKLGRHLSACSKERASEQFASTNGCNCWKFGGPTGPFIHIVIAFCLILPKLLMQARFIEAGFFPQDMIWRTDLNFMSLNNDQTVILNFMTLTSNETTKGSNTKLSTEPTVTTTNTEDNTISDSNVEKSINSMSLASAVVNILKDYIGTDDRNYNVLEHERTNQISIEFINFTLALGIYAVRYASLFWATNKWLSLLFSVQLLINGMQILLSYAGVSILYKMMQSLHRVIMNNVGSNGDIVWPPRSPDLSVCDYLWGYLKAKVFEGYPPRTIQALKQRIREEIEAIPVNMLRMWSCKISRSDYTNP
ncbi:hypothetical protein AMK59_1417, partial [Oryctes borbonicus]